jgi:ABC-type multidrug transport system fused ATPase/permease subunit
MLGDQRQRFQAKNNSGWPRILENTTASILDEPTSALDSEIELYVLEALERLMVGCPRLLFRPGVPCTDRIIVLNEGSITDREALLEKPPRQSGRRFRR